MAKKKNTLSDLSKFLKEKGKSEEDENEDFYEKAPEKLVNVKKLDSDLVPDLSQLSAALQKLYQEDASEGFDQLLEVILAVLGDEEENAEALSLINHALYLKHVKLIKDKLSK
ncbi:MAG: hypothetical protein LAT68_05995 [Cyclobacteriaceae bacterium]|nr:hypothetical protein [Cyclobacteriaceae bacterium]MCH8515863.1 hypothetical protein [Cyclobacteriaceae bacterium]